MRGRPIDLPKPDWHAGFPPPPNGPTSLSTVDADERLKDDVVDDDETLNEELPPPPPLLRCLGAAAGPAAAAAASFGSWCCLDGATTASSSSGSPNWCESRPRRASRPSAILVFFVFFRAEPFAAIVGRGGGAVIASAPHAHTHAG